MDTMPTYIFMGSPTFAVTILDGLVKAGWTPALVVTEPPKPVGRKHELTPTAVDRYARSNHLAVTTPATKADLIAAIDDIPSLDLIIVAAYGKILPQAILNLPRYGAVNVHASLLPKYRGASPIQAALLAGDAQTGITFMAMEAGLDTGPIVATVTVPITQTDTTPLLTEKLAAAAATSIVPVIASYLSNPTKLSLQSHAQATVAPKLTKRDGQISLGTIDPITLDRMIRAYSPWPGVFTEELPQGRLKVLAGHLDSAQYTITKLQWAGKSPVDGATFARSYPDVLTKLPPLITLGLD